jgi:serine/threonine-protein kinase
LLAERYRLTRPLGEGGMGDVWQASHVVTGRAVAIKQLRLALDGGSDDVARLRFAFEARAACAATHPNVVEILDFLELAGRPPLIVMELLRGETLAAKLEREQILSVSEALRLFVPVASAVGTAHSRGIVHRDLKPANIFLAREVDEVRVKLLDFGIAKQLAPLADEPLLRTQTGSSLGTPCYMAPEQAMGERLLDHRADIWSLGVIFYEVLSGARPVEGENAARMMVSLLSTGIIPLEQLVPDLPPELSALVGRMLSRDPALRPEDLREVSAILGRLTPERAPAFGPPPAERASRVTPTVSSIQKSAAAVATVAQEFPVAVASPSSRARAWSRPRALAVSALLAGALTLGVWALRGVPPKPAEGDRLAAAPAQNPPAAVPASRSSLVLDPPSPSTPPPASSLRPAPRRLAPRAPAAAVSAPKPEPAAPSLVQGGLPAGAPCERSRECASRLCLAFACQGS